MGLDIEIPYIIKLKAQDQLNVVSTYIKYIEENQKAFKPEKNSEVKKDNQQVYDQWFKEF
jgi:hypothetical protein